MDAALHSPLDAVPTAVPLPTAKVDFARAHRAARRMLSAELQRAQSRILSSVAELPGPGGVAARHLSEQPGKLIRPMLVGLVHRALGGKGGPVVARAAAVVETIHLSTLLHDDVVDAASLRRGLPSANAVAGNTAAVLGGDAMVVQGLTEAQALGPHALQRALAALHSLVQGELLQLGHRRNVHITPQEVLVVASLKTGALMRLCAQLGALTAGAPAEVADAWGHAFERLGVGFQVADDVLDLAGDPALLGKAVGADVQQGTLSYPVALALTDSPLHARALAAAFVRQLPGEALGRVVNHALARTRALPRALAVAQRELQPALDVVAATPAGRARTVLMAVCQGLVRRAQ
jgi:heptaprenyl diphosphate synthase